LSWGKYYYDYWRLGVSLLIKSVSSDQWVVITVLSPQIHYQFTTCVHCIVLFMCIVVFAWNITLCTLVIIGDHIASHPNPFVTRVFRSEQSAKLRGGGQSELLGVLCSATVCCDKLYRSYCSYKQTVTAVQYICE
jgi:hypothetical protein